MRHVLALGKPTLFLGGGEKIELQSLFYMPTGESSSLSRAYQGEKKVCDFSKFISNYFVLKNYLMDAGKGSFFYCESHFLNPLRKPNCLSFFIIKVNISRTPSPRLWLM